MPDVTSSVPDTQGRFGPYGGRFVPETLMHALRQLTDEYLRARDDPEFQKQLQYYLEQYVGRPSPLYFAERLTREAGGACIYLKREDLNHTGAHKINNCIGQALLTKRMGKPRVIAETGAGQHGVATATAAALFGLQCQVYMGEEDVRRQKLNVFKMKALGSEVIPVKPGGRGAKRGDHAATLNHGKPGVLHGTFSYVLQDADGQTADVHSVSAGLDYPGVGPEHSYWKDSGRITYTSVDDAAALECFNRCSRLEGILPALETAHAVVEAMRLASRRGKDDVVVVCFSGRGDKDCYEVARLQGESIE